MIIIIPYKKRVSGISGMEHWNGMVEWNAGMEYWNGMILTFLNYLATHVHSI